MSTKLLKRSQTTIHFLPSNAPPPRGLLLQPGVGPQHRDLFPRKAWWFNGCFEGSLWWDIIMITYAIFKGWLGYKIEIKHDKSTMGMSWGKNGINHQHMTWGLVPDSGNLHTPMYGFNQKWKYDPKEESIHMDPHSFTPRRNLLRLHNGFCDLSLVRALMLRDRCRDGCSHLALSVDHGFSETEVKKTCVFIWVWLKMEHP